MAFRKKAQLLLPYQPDIVVVPECECPEKLVFGAGTPLPQDLLWYGQNPHKGLGVFSYSNFRFRLLEAHDPEIRTILPITVSGGDLDFTLFAVWANHPQAKQLQYSGQMWQALQAYDQLIQPERSILIGDFNSNTIWDRKNRAYNHSNIVARLGEKGIHSAYHVHFDQIQGQEKQPTFYLYRQLNKPYHLDYCFASQDFTQKLNGVDVGLHEQWATYSDHVPLLVEY